ncbi:MAG: hypothetical protein RRZ65_04585 [Tannerellaceae bacterium]
MKSNGMLIAFALLLSYCGVGTAQEYKDFDLSTYKLPDIVRHELDFSLKSNGEFNDESSSGNDKFSINGDFQSAFKRYKNTRSFLGRQQADLQIGGHYNNDKQTDIKNSSYSVTASYSNSSRFYTSNRLFFETGGSAEFAFGENKSVDKTDRTAVVASIPLRVGKGRIEQVEDARQAIYILENLAKRGVLNRRLSNDEVYTFSQVISTVKNKRFFDSRLRMIDEITTVDSFLVKNNLLATAGAPYFTTLYDYWMYGALFKRGSGTEISGGLTPGVHYERQKAKDAISKRTMPTLLADVLLTYEKPVNLYWQHSAFVQLYGQYGRLIDKDKDNDMRMDDYSTGLSGKYAWGFYPTSRTNLNFGIMESFGWDKLVLRNSSLNNISYLNNNTSAFVEFYYYFSPQLRLSMNASLDFHYNRILGDASAEKKDNFMWNGNYNATLTYSLF